jgi:hypothetical protein
MTAARLQPIPCLMLRWRQTQALPGKETCGFSMCPQRVGRGARVSTRESGGGSREFHGRASSGDEGYAALIRCS